MVGFRPRLGPTLFAIPVVLLCLALGFWQLQRLHWKERLIAQRQAGLSAAAVAPPRTLDEARALEFHPIALVGVFLNDKELFLGASAESGRLGYQVLTPLREASGRIVFVDRGFIPSELRDPDKRAAGQFEGRVRITGLLRLPPERKPGGLVSAALPDNRPDRNYWFWIDLPAMAAADRLDPGQVAPFYVDADKTPNPGGWPQGGVTRLDLPNDHLQYAITWFALAIAMVVIYIAYHRSNPPR